MEVKIDKNILYFHLYRAQNIVEKKTTLPILSNILIETQKSTLKLSFTDLEVGITENCQAKILQQGKTTIHARKFFEIIRELPEGEIHLEQKKNQLQIKSGRSKFLLRSLSPDEFPKIPSIQASESIKLPNHILQEMIQKTAIAISTDEAHYTLTGFLLQMESKTEQTLLRLITTDGHRLCLCERILPETQMLSIFSDESREDKNIILPRKGVQEIKRLLEEDEENLEFGIFQENAFIRKKEFSMIMRLVQGKFPDHQAVIPSVIEKTIRADASLLEEAMRRVSVLSSEKSKGIRFFIEPNKITFFSNSPEIGEAQEEIDVDYQEEPFEVAFNVRYMLDLLQVVKGEITLKFGKELRPCMIQEKEDEQFTYIIMPLRI